MAPIGGTISTRVVQVGDAVAAGDTMFMVEAMKFPVAAEVSGVVAGIFVNEGDTFNGGRCDRRDRPEPRLDR